MDTGEFALRFSACLVYRSALRARLVATIGGSPGQDRTSESLFIFVLYATFIFFLYATRLR
jgi:hypothetical protein